MKISIIDADGREIRPPAEIVVRANELPPGYFQAPLAIAIAMPGFTFPHQGDYQIQIVLDGQLKLSVPLKLKLLLVPPQQS